MFARDTPATGADALARLSWHDFEHLLAEHYREQGWRVQYHAPPASLKAHDGSLDLRLHRGNDTVIVQCKHWDADEVQLPEVNELLSTMLNEAATRGVLVTRGRFSADARAVPRRQPRLQLVDGDVLRVMLKLPDRRDTSVAGVALPTVEARKAAVAKRRRADASHSRLLPLLLVGGIVLLIGVFVWRTMNHRQEALASTPPAEEITATPAPAAALAHVSVPAPAPAAVEEPLSRELAERARLGERTAPASSHEGRRPSEDGMKVLEHNTREVGSAE